MRRKRGFCAPMKSKVNNRMAAEETVANSAGAVLESVSWLVPITIAAVTLGVFFPVLQNSFLAWDDQAAFLENPHYRGLGWAELRWMFTTFYTGHYQPLSWMTLGLDYLLWGMDPFGYHLTNLFLHAANALIFYFFALRLLALALFPSATPQEAVALRLAAGVAALLFSIHPLRVESVAWVTERRDVLSAFFFLGALLCYLQAAAMAQTRRRRLAWLSSALGLYILSLLAKASGMTLPVVLVVLDVYPLKRLGGGPEKWFGREVRTVWWEKLPFLGFGLAAAVIAGSAQYQTGAMLSLEQHGIIPRIGQAFFGLAFYLWKTVVPLNLSPLYEIPRTIQLWDGPFLLSEVVVIVISAALVLVSRWWPAGLAVWMGYATILAPTLGIAQTGPQFVADRYSYLSCLGWAILAGAGLYRCWRGWWNHRVERWIFTALVGLAAVVIAGLGFLTWRQTQVWRNTESLWRYALDVTPESSIAHYNLAFHLKAQDKLNEAVEHYRHAVRINPGYVEAHTNLANALSGRGQLDDALGHYREALRLSPGSVEAYNNLGIALVKKGNVEEAIERYHAALKIAPAHPKAHYNLGNALARQGKLDEAIEEYRQTLKIDSGDIMARNNLGTALAGRGDFDEAIKHFREVLKVHPADPGPRYNIGNMFAMQGKFDEAIEQYRQLLSKAPEFVQAHENLARLLLRQGKRVEAIKHMEEALRLLRTASAAPPKK